MAAASDDHVPERQRDCDIRQSDQRVGRDVNGHEGRVPQIAVSMRVHPGDIHSSKRRPSQQGHRGGHGEGGDLTWGQDATPFSSRPTSRPDNATQRCSERICTLPALPVSDCTRQRLGVQTDFTVNGKTCDGVQRSTYARSVAVRSWRDAAPRLGWRDERGNFVAGERRRGREAARKCGRYVAGSRMSLDRTLKSDSCVRPVSVSRGGVGCMCTDGVAADS